MSTDIDPNRINDIDSLVALYGAPSEASIRKEVSYLHPQYRAILEASPLAVLATAGPEGLDASPRGDAPGFVTVLDEHTLLIPDRRGNNRIDSLRNIVRDPRVALLFLVPGLNETLRVNGTAHISVAPDLIARFVVDGKAPRTVIVLHIESVYFQCARAILRSSLWDASQNKSSGDLPTPGALLAALTKGEIDGPNYDTDLSARIKTTLY